MFFVFVYSVQFDSPWVKRALRPLGCSECSQYSTARLVVNKGASPTFDKDKTNL